jgi:transcriptional regulator with XRE-family HTH domain
LYVVIRAKKPDITEARMRIGLSQRGLCRVTGLSSPFISQLENQNRNASPEAVKKICEALNMTFDHLFEIVSN